MIFKCNGAFRILFGAEWCDWDFPFSCFIWQGNGVGQQSRHINVWELGEAAWRRKRRRISVGEAAHYCPFIGFYLRNFKWDDCFRESATPTGSISVMHCKDAQRVQVRITSHTKRVNVKRTWMCGARHQLDEWGKLKGAASGGCGGQEDLHKREWLCDKSLQSFVRLTFEKSSAQEKTRRNYITFGHTSMPADNEAEWRSDEMALAYI